VWIQTTAKRRYVFDQALLGVLEPLLLLLKLLEVTSEQLPQYQRSRIARMAFLPLILLSLGVVLTAKQLLHLRDCQLVR